jgi:integrase
MGTIVARRRKDGTTGYTAQILKKQNGSIIHREAQTFDRKQAAEAWIRKRETELAAPGALDRAKRPDVTLADAIDRYTETSRRAIGRTKTQVLRSIKEYDIAQLDCGAISSSDIVSFAELLAESRKPQTVANYLSHLAAVFAVAQPAWGYRLNRDAMRDAQAVLRRMEITAKSAKRNRRPTLDELEMLMTHFSERQMRTPTAAPMHRIIAFAIFSTRRMEEITRIGWRDLNAAHKRVLVRDMKNPGQKIGNDVWCDLPDEALGIVQTTPRVADRIFPYSTDAIGAAFTRACKLLNIDDLHFHDLRHDGVSRLFEIGWNIPHVAAVSGHRSWGSLQRYTHLRQTGDKYADWRWLPLVKKT